MKQHQKIRPVLNYGIAVALCLMLLRVGPISSARATEPSSLYNVDGQKRTRNCAPLAAPTEPLRFPDGTLTGFYAYGDDPSSNGSGTACTVGSTEIDAQEIITNASGMRLYFRPGGGPDQYVDPVNKGQYGHILAQDLAPAPTPQPQNLNGHPCGAAGPSSRASAANLIGVADDGAVYACNTSSSVFPPQFVVYRWASEASTQAVVFAGDPANGNTNGFNLNWGNTFAVRGSGTNTQILVTSHGRLVALLQPTNSAMTGFASTPIQTDATPGALGAGLVFGSGNRFWAMGDAGDGPLLHLAFNLTNGTATTLRSYDAAAFPGTISALAISGNTLAGLDTVVGPDLVRLYDIANAQAAPVLNDRRAWPFNNENTNRTGSLVFIGTNRLAVLDSENGLWAFTITSGASNSLAPWFYLSPADESAGAAAPVTFLALADGTAPLSYRWQLNGVDLEGATNSTLSTTAQPANAGTYRAIATNLYGAATSASASLTITGAVSSALLDYEPFAYAPDNTLAGQGGWVLNSGSSATIQPGSFIVPMLPPALGNHFNWTSSSMSVRLPIGSWTNGDLYFSLSLRVNSVTSGSSDTLAGFTTGTTTSFSPKLNIASAAAPGAYSLGVYKSSGLTTGGLATNVFQIGEVVFVVVRYRFNNGSTTDDTCDLWLNPPVPSFGATTPPVATLADVGNGAGRTDMGVIDRFFFRSASAAASIDADELRIGTNWAAVTPFFRPALTFAKSGAASTLLWPTNASAFHLEQTGSLAAASWSTVPDAPQVSDTNFSVAVAPTNGQRFYRLRL